MKSGIYVSELSASRHAFESYHFCRGNSNRRKSRFGVILEGAGTYIYLNKRLRVEKGDVVFIPENIYCYSEWRGSPHIEVVYVSCFMHYEDARYEPQVLEAGEEARRELLAIAELLPDHELLAYSRFYGILGTLLPLMRAGDVWRDKTLESAIEYMTGHWNERIAVRDVARHCCVSESTLYHLFQRELGETPVRFLNSIRINVAIEYLENSHYSVSTVARTVAFPSENHFRRVFREYTGMTPSAYKRAGKRDQGFACANSAGETPSRRENSREK